MTFEAKQNIIIRNCYALPNMASAFQDQIRQHMERAAHAEKHNDNAKGGILSKRRCIIRYLDKHGEAPAGTIRSAVHGDPSVVTELLPRMVEDGTLTVRIGSHPLMRTEVRYYSLAGGDQC